MKQTSLRLSCQILDLKNWDRFRNGVLFSHEPAKNNLNLNEQILSLTRLYPKNGILFKTDSIGMLNYLEVRHSLLDINFIKISESLTRAFKTPWVYHQIFVKEG